MIIINVLLQFALITEAPCRLTERANKHFSLLSSWRCGCWLLRVTHLRYKGVLSQDCPIQILAPFPRVEDDLSLLRIQNAPKAQCLIFKL